MSFRKIYKNSFKAVSKSNYRFTGFVSGISKESGNKQLLPRKIGGSVSKSFEKELEYVPFMINLEDFMIIERNLSLMIDKFNYPNLIISACEEVWDMTADNTLNQLCNLFRDERTKGTIRFAMVLQALGISITHYFVSEFSLHQEMALIIRSIIFSIHQAFLIFTKFALSRVTSDNSNSWAQKLRLIIKEKKIRKHHIDTTSFLDHYNQQIAQSLKKICRNFISKSDDHTIRALKLSVLQILRNKTISISDARALIEKAFGIKNEVLEKAEVKEKIPYLPFQSSKLYTLVLDLDETLIHYFDDEDQGKYLARPYVCEFLKMMNRDYEIVIFTASIQKYADWILDDLDKENMISYRLYRQHTIPAGNHFLKDLKLLGRDLSKVIIVDNVSDNFQLQSENGILIKSWYDDMTDNTLKELSEFLIDIPNKKIEDVRVFLKNYRDLLLKDSLPII
jgi:CTD small phosphatase-like protein 2